MTQRKITTIMAAIALSAPMMASGFVQAAPYGHDYLFSSRPRLRQWRHQRGLRVGEGL